MSERTGHLPRAPIRVRNHITLNGDACPLQRLAKGVSFFAIHRFASSKSSFPPVETQHSLRRRAHVRRDRGLNRVMKSKSRPARRETMLHLRFIATLIASVLLSASSFAGTTYFVGTCQPKKPSYATISQAVSSVPAGSIIEVCPGKYPEQVVITMPLTLEGIPGGKRCGGSCRALGGHPDTICARRLSKRRLLPDTGAEHDRPSHHQQSCRGWNWRECSSE